MKPLLVLTTTIILFVSAPPSLSSAATPAQRRQARQIRTETARAQRFVKLKRFDESLKLLDRIQTELKELAGQSPDQELIRLLSPLVREVKQLHGALELEGRKPPALDLPSLASGEPPLDSSDNKPAGPRGDKISFTRQVAPLLASKCGRCHVKDTKGDFSMASYAALRRGVKDVGVVLTPGGSRGSRLIEVIEIGDMPRGGGKVSRQELALLSGWIDQGAKFDGRDPNAPLGALVGPGGATPAPSSQTPSPKVVRATGKETVRFALDVAPVLAENCLPCHGRGRSSSGLSMATFNALLRGGDNGPIVNPGQSARSLIVRKLKGTADGARMPLQRPPLSDDLIAKIETWIAEGATFDGPDADMPLETVSALVRTASSTAQQVSDMRAETARKNWRLALPNQPATSQTTEHFLLVGNVPSSLLTQIGAAAEKQRSQIAKTIGQGGKEPLIKGRVTIFVPARRFEYSEFGTMVEGVDLPAAERSHYSYSIVDAYVCLTAPREVDEAVEAQLAEELAGVYLSAASAAQTPRWFTEGSARAIVARIHPRHDRVQAWNDALPTALARIKQPDDFMEGRLDNASEAALSYGFCQALLSNSAKYRMLLKSVGAGDSLAQAMQESYGAQPAQLAAAWLTKVASRRR